MGVEGEWAEQGEHAIGGRVVEELAEKGCKFPVGSDLGPPGFTFFTIIEVEELRKKGEICQSAIK